MTKVSETVLGVHIAAGTLWFAQAKGDGGFVDDRVDRIECSDALGDPRALSEMERDLEDLLGRLDPAAVALLKAGSGGRAPAPSDTLRRGRVEGIVLLASHRAETPIDLVTHDAVKKLVGVRPRDGGYNDAASRLLGCDKPNRWSERAPAYGAAAVVCQRSFR